jgi:hypothetical protein
LNGDGAKLTLCEDKVVLLDELLEGVRLQLRDIGSSDKSGEQGRADSGALHTGRTKLQLKWEVEVEVGWRGEGK